MNIAPINNLSFKSVYYVGGCDLKSFEYRDVVENLSKDDGLDYYVGEGHIAELHPCYKITIIDPETKKFVKSVNIDPDLLGWPDDEDFIKEKLLR